ncbi:oxidative stress-induced growth inhibitor 2 [Elysia marginata]|uniref:Oxidative stress-induced growth inhibitor 2 n=1 Tax=Elysia marginata TaxID=1093978 RepID=A0AAV4GDV0_9GAST|nr:oxidative stress-induced growth inhibitor 2 [Elysia marginata]
MVLSWTRSRPCMIKTAYTYSKGKGYSSQTSDRILYKTMASNEVGVQHSADAQHYEVVIIGNGPSAIALSFMLSGYRPYYNGAPLSNEYLLQRLQDAGTVSLFEQDLRYLSEGLEGRSNNPVALLFDHLFHPDADLGVDVPSALDWKYDSQHYIPHVVLGKTKPGGTWQKIDGTMHTISQSSWMELPNVVFKDWLVSPDRTKSYSWREHNPVAGRATIADVKDYYTDYIKSQGLAKNFKDFHTVTSVQQVYHLRNIVDSESGEVEPCCGNVRRNHPHCWEVRGYSSHSNSPQETLRNAESGEEVINQQRFCYVAPHVVLAVGTYDIPNRLGVEGESLSCVVHSLGAFEEALLNLKLELSGGSSCLSSPDPVLVVGAGLSAADAILTAMDAGVPVIHVFRRAPTNASLVFSKLPRAMYPEYHRVHRLMKGEEHSPLYTPMPKQTLMEVRDKAVLIGSASANDGANKFKSSSTSTSLTWVDISLVAIMVGSRSDLGFLPREGRNLGIVAKWPIDSKHNVIDVDPFTYQSNRRPQMFAMGPLVGDNFVRFGIGGALAIVNHLNKCRKKEIL